MENYQIFAIILSFAVILAWVSKIKKINMKGRLVDEDKFEQKRLLDTYYMIYLPIVLVISLMIWNSANIGRFIFDNFNKLYFAPMQIAVSIFLIFWILAFLIRPKKDAKNNKKIIAKPNSTFKLSPKKLNIGILEGHFLNSKLRTYLSYVIRVDDFTIQKIKFDKEGILLKREYIKKVLENNIFTDEDYNIISKVEEEIKSRNDYNFKYYDVMEKRISQLIKAIQSQKKYTFAFGQIKQYSNSPMIDEILLFLQEIQENRYSDISLPYLIHYQKIVK